MSDSFVRIEGVRPGQPPTYYRVSTIIRMTEAADGRRLIQTANGLEHYISKDALVTEVTEADMVKELITPGARPA